MDKRYLTAFLTPKKHKVAGVWLDAFCCRHMITLEAINSPLIKDNPSGEIPSVDDLVVAIMICSTPSWTEAIKEPSFFQKLKFNMLSISIESLNGALEEFALYIKESTSMPKLWTKDNNSNGGNEVKSVSKQKLPNSLQLVVFLMSKMHLSEEEAWNMVFCKAVWYSIGYASQEGGDIDVITTEDEERAEEDVKALEEIEKNAKEARRNHG